jgi:lysophospholipase L1-like esterase
MNIDRISFLLSPIVRPLLRSMMANAKAHMEVLPVVTSCVVFLGDSITAGGYWNEWFAELLPLNRGINANTVGDVIERLETAIHSPRIVSLMIGTNDLSGLGLSREPIKIAAQMRELVRRIRAYAPTAKLLVNSVSPRSAFFAARIRELNQHYRQIAAEAAVDYVDLWPMMADPDGAIRKALTTDGLHFTGEGYRVWAEVLRPYLVGAQAEVQLPPSEQSAKG